MLPLTIVTSCSKTVDINVIDNDARSLNNCDVIASSSEVSRAQRIWHSPSNVIDSISSGSLQWRHNERDSVSNHQPRDYLLRRLIRRRPKKSAKLRITGLCAGNSPVTGEFPAQTASNSEYISIWWRYHVRHEPSMWHPWIGGTDIKPNRSGYTRNSIASVRLQLDTKGWQY